MALRVNGAAVDAGQAFDLQAGTNTLVVEARRGGVDLHVLRIAPEC